MLQEQKPTPTISPYLFPTPFLDTNTIKSFLARWQYRNIEKMQKAKRTAAGIPTWSPTVVLICRSAAYVWQSGRDAQFSADCGRTCRVGF